MIPYDLTTHDGLPSGGLFTRVKRSIGNAVCTVQYARMLKVMSELSDTQLESIGLARADIPRIAREAIYGQER